MSVGKSIRLYLADGTPGGLLTAEIMNWTGHMVAAPRSDLAALLKRPETFRTGIYVLLGDDPESLGGTLAYIGEGDEVRTRLQQHARDEEQGGKDFWDRAIVLTSKDANLTKAHARYLESRFIALAQHARRARLINGTAPPLPPLPEADESDMEYFIAQAAIILPVLGVNILRSAAAVGYAEAAPASAAVSSPVFELRLKKEGISATAREIDGEFTVLEGSGARMTWTGVEHAYKVLHEKLVREGVIVPTADGRTMRFARNQVFASPSAAAAVVVGRTANGRHDWKIQGSGVSYGDWQAQGIDQAAEKGRDSSNDGPASGDSGLSTAGLPAADDSDVRPSSGPDLRPFSNCGQRALCCSRCPAFYVDGDRKCQRAVPPDPGLGAASPNDLEALVDGLRGSVEVTAGE